jgi:hypothetical protein
MEDEIMWIKIMALRVGKASWTPLEQVDIHSE